jgi:hypothetical protein
MISLSHAKQFYKLWSAWLGDGGKPVDQGIARARANICFKCPMNAEKGITQLLMESAASVVHRQIEVKNGLHLHVQGEENLNLCSACFCVLSLKVWVPDKHILDNTDLEPLHPDCWIRKLSQPLCS